MTIAGEFGARETTLEQHMAAQPVEIEAGEFRWRLALHASVERLERVVASFPECDQQIGARRLKHNRLRTVFFVPDGDSGADEDRSASESAASDDSDPSTWPPGTIAKWYRYPSFGERARYRVFPSRAQAEWRALGRFERLGIPAPRRLAIGMRHGRGDFEEGLLLEFLVGTLPISAVVHESESPWEWGLQRPLFPRTELSERQRCVLEAAGRAVRTLHDRGAWHRDLHPGNLLFDEARRELYFIDLHSCRFLPRVPRSLRRRGVVELFHHLGVSVPREGARTFLESYGVGALFGAGVTIECALARLDAALLARRRKWIRSRSKRCLVRSTMFEIVSGRGERLYHRREWDAEALRDVCADDSRGELVKSSARGAVAQADCSGRRVCVKRRRYSVRESLRALVERHRLLRAYAAGHSLWVRGVPTPSVVALREVRRFGLVREAQLVTEWVSGAEPLHELLFARWWDAAVDRVAPAERRLVAERVGGFVRSVHEEGLYPHDLSPQNVLATEGLFARGDGDASREVGSGAPALFLVDLDHLYLWQKLSVRRRRKNLSQIGNLPEGHVRSLDLLHALRTYAAHDRAWWSREFVAELRADVLDEHLRVVLRRSCPSSGASIGSGPNNGAAAAE